MTGARRRTIAAALIALVAPLHHVALIVVAAAVVVAPIVGALLHLTRRVQIDLRQVDCPWPVWLANFGADCDLWQAHSGQFKLHGWDPDSEA